MTIRTLTLTALAASFMLAGPSFAQDKMKKDDAMMKDGKMEKSDTMMKDDKMAKDTNMADDKMKKN